MREFLGPTVPGEPSQSHRHGAEQLLVGERIPQRHRAASCLKHRAAVQRGDARMLYCQPLRNASFQTNTEAYENIAFKQNKLTRSTAPPGAAAGLLHRAPLSSAQPQRAHLPRAHQPQELLLPLLVAEVRRLPAAGALREHTPLAASPLRPPRGPRRRAACRLAGPGPAPGLAPRPPAVPSHLPSPAARPPQAPRPFTSGEAARLRPC